MFFWGGGKLQNRKRLDEKKIEPLSAAVTLAGLLLPKLPANCNCIKQFVTSIARRRRQIYSSNNNVIFQITKHLKHVNLLLFCQKETQKK